MELRMWSPDYSLETKETYPKKCPMNDFRPCKEELCAWWKNSVGCCAILDLAKAMGSETKDEYGA